jgi:FkbM family methyltransferase
MDVKIFLFKLRDFIYLNVYGKICYLLGKQYLRQSIGKVKIPYFAKHYLKRSVAQQGEDLLLDRVITRVLKRDVFKPRIYVDVGAYHPIDHSATYLLYARGWKGVVFDPSFETERLFNKWRPRDVFVRAIVGELEELTEFYTPKSSTSGLSLTGTKYPFDKKLFNKERHRQVNLNDELKRQRVHHMDVLNIDVEGAELEILQSFDFDYFSPSVILVEIHGNNILECLETEEAKLILKNGYKAVGCAIITFIFVREEECDTI